MFEQERVIGRLQRRVMSEAAIVCCFLGGAHGRANADDYSDIDVALVYASDTARERAWQDRHAFAQSVMPYVPLKGFDAVHIRPYFYVTLFANGSKLDYRYESIESLPPIAMDGRLRILKDDAQQSAEKHQRASAQLSAPAASFTSAELVELDRQFWVMFWDVLRLLARGDIDKPFQIYVQMLHATLPPLLNALPVDDPAHQALVNVYYSRDTTATASQMSGLLASYLTARQAIVERHHLAPIDDRAFETEIQRHIQRLT